MGILKFKDLNFVLTPTISQVLQTVLPSLYNMCKAATVCKLLSRSLEDVMWNPIIMYNELQLINPVYSLVEFIHPWVFSPPPV